jgi:DNA-binding transcriptional regulator YiaG
MLPKKLTAKRDGAAVPEWSRKIANFRNSLKLSQYELGKQLGTSAMAVSRWGTRDSRNTW